MPVIHVKKAKHFYALIDYRILDDRRLSWKARGILAYLLSKPDDWEVHVNDLIAHSEDDGRTAVQSALQELLNCGYAKLETVRDKEGKVRGKQYCIYDLEEAPFELRQATDKQENRQSGKPSIGAADEQENRLTENLPVGEEPYVVTGDNRRAGKPSVGKTVSGETRSIRREDLKDKNQEEEKQESHNSQSSRREQTMLLDHHAEEVLAYLNEIQGRNLSRSTQIRALLGTGVSVEDCKLVIDWLYHVERLSNPEGYEKYANNVTPFRPDNFDVNRDKARRWKMGIGATHKPRSLIL